MERKRAGEEIVLETHRAEPTRVVDLMAALEASVAAARGNEAEPARARQRSRPIDKASALGELSKAELYERASELDVPGRSKMTRQELEEAVAEAGGSRRRRKAS